MVDPAFREILQTFFDSAASPQFLTSFKELKGHLFFLWNSIVEVFSTKSVFFSVYLRSLTLFQLSVGYVLLSNDFECTDNCV